MTKSITTKAGDFGQTYMRHSGKVFKNNTFVNMVGEIDELVSFIGVARVSVKSHYVKERLEDIQRGLFELAADMNDFGNRINDSFMASFDAEHKKLESMIEFPKDFILPGGRNSVAGGHIDVCRSVSRRLERSYYNIGDHVRSRTHHFEEQIMQYLNRLSDHFWYLARLEEGDSLMQKDE